MGSEAVLNKILLTSKDKEKLAEELKNLDFEKDIKGWAALKNITNVVELKEPTEKSWVGSRDKVPFSRNQLRNPEDVGFYTDKKYLNFNYFLLVNDRQFFITQQVDDLNLLLYLEVYKIGLTILEYESDNNAHALYTTLPKSVAEDLARNTSIDEQGLMSEPKTFSKETYMVNAIEMIPHAPLRQKMLFTKKMSSYEILSAIDILIFIWTFFCISIVLNVVLFKYADR